MIAQCASDNLDFWVDTQNRKSHWDLPFCAAKQIYCFLLVQVVKEISFGAVLDWLQSQVFVVMSKNMLLML